jgi:hypothetical protein
MDRDQIRNAVRRLMLKSLATDIPADAAAPLSQVHSRQRKTACRLALKSLNPMPLCCGIRLGPSSSASLPLIAKFFL